MVGVAVGRGSYRVSGMAVWVGRGHRVDGVGKGSYRVSGLVMWVGGGHRVDGVCKGSYWVSRLVVWVGGGRGMVHISVMVSHVVRRMGCRVGRLMVSWLRMMVGLMRCWVVIGGR